jgi:4-hydroxybenzoate polyprenyltransferase
LINKLISFLKLIRIQNLIILFLIQFLLHYFLFDNQGNIEFYLLASITFLITSAGYIINDIFDIESDKINKEEVIIGNQIHIRQAIFWYYLFNSLAIILSFILVYCVNNYPLLFIFLFTIYILWWYSKKYQQLLLIGNIIVALLTCLSIYNVYLFSDSSLSISPYIGWEFFSIILLVFFSFFLTLSREIIKDLEDTEGDKLMNSKNIAVTVSLSKIKWVVSVLLIIVLIPLLCILVSLVNKLIYFYSAKLLLLYIYCSYICFLIIYTIYKIKLSDKKPNFTRVSQLLKFIMILGIFSVPLFFYFL